MHGCHFHFCKAIYDRMITSGLKRDYEQNEHFKKFVRMVFSPAFLPMADVEPAIELLLLDYIPQHIPDMMPRENFHDFMNYLENTWLGPARRFALELWNVYDLNDRRTNNSIEGWHRSSNDIFGMRPKLWKFIDCMKKEERLTDNAIGLIAGGRAMAYRKAAVTEKERRIAVMRDTWDAPNHGGIYPDVLAYLDELSFLQLDGV